jgi:resuscitation-promoting factor RpfA
MMITTKLYARAGAAAIAAVLALSSTSVGAQEVPSITETPPTASPPPVPTPTPDGTSETIETTAPATDTAEPPPETISTPVKATRSARKVATHSVATRDAKSRSAAPKAPTSAAVAGSAAKAASPSAPKPIVDLTNKSANAPVAQTAPKPAQDGPNDTVMEIAGGALALLALSGGAYAVIRRRRKDEMTDEVYESDYEPEMDTAEASIPRHDPVVDKPELAVVTPSAFAWGNAHPVGQPLDEDGSDRRPGETWVDRAYRGPSPANPSVSLRARLKRAVFFDKREREVAAGTAEPVEADVGLPESMVEEQEAERERHAA